MTSVIYPWKRFWCPRVGQLNLSDGGYLWDPDNKYASIYNPDVKNFSEIEKHPVLGLLGEPGIGKSFAIDQLVENTKSQIVTEGGYVLYLNLNAICSEARLEKKLFDSIEFKTWETKKKPLHIFLDSFDECLLSVPTLSRFLSEEFKTRPTRSLFIRIACRTHDWPIGLEEFLKAKWAEGDVGVYELTPLRQIDVIQAAKINGLDPEKFIEEIQNNEVVPLAIKPLTLQMLINIFKKEIRFPASKSELYRKGCLFLAEESNKSRRDAKQFGNLSPEQRVIVAARIAALTVFGGKNAVWTGPVNGEIPDEDLTLANITGEVKATDGSKIAIDETTLREVLGDTGFFSSRGVHRTGWAHQTYAEYLAAFYLGHCKANLDQVISLLCHPENPGKNLTPQLTEVAAWVSSMNDEVFSYLMGIDPEALLRGDFSSIGTESKKGLTQELLALYEKGDAVDNDWTLRDHYNKLEHPNLTNQLLPYITDSSKNVIVRRVAIDIAEACNLTSLQEELLVTALNQSEDYHIRSQATHAICLIGDDKTKQSLKPLAFGQAGDDPDDELKGQALRILWPIFISAEDLFSQLSPPQNENLIGAYYDFLYRRVAQGFGTDNLLVALEWMELSYPSWKDKYRSRELAKSILTKAWELLNSAEIAKAFLRAISVLFKKHDLRPIESLISNDEKHKRRILINALLTDFCEEKLDTYLCFQANFVNPDDIPWLIGRSKNEPQQIRQYLAELTKCVFNYQHTNIVLTICEEDPMFAEEFKFIREPVRLDSPEADRMRRCHYGRDRNHEKISPTPMERIIKNLEKSEAGQVNVWPSLLCNLNLDEYGSGGWPNFDYRESCGWKNAETETKRRIIVATKEYLINGSPKIESLFEKSTKLEAFASDYALRMLFKEDSDFVLSLDSNAWNKWAKVVLVSSYHDQEDGQTLLRLAYKSVPDQVIEGILQTIDKEKNGQTIFLHHIKDIWDDRLSQAVFAKLSITDLTVGVEGSLLGLLLEQGFKEALTFTKSIITNPPPADEMARKRALVAAANLMMYADDAGWSIIWPIIQADSDFGHELIEKISGRERIIPRLADDQAADLYIWLEQNRPHSEEKNDNDNLLNGRGFNEKLFSHLKTRGTHSACIGLAKIASAFPEQVWLKWSLRECQSLYRRATWCPPSPQEILSLTENRDFLLVRSGQELLDVIIASLKRLEQTLHGVTPMATFLWNNNRPRSENDFSDYVKNHLENDLNKRGFFANREVEFRRLKQSGVGEKTDIVVDAVCQFGEQFETVSVVIESKGCWNKDLKTAMEFQLRDRYLIDDQHRIGLYLVGWFLCDKWDGNHDQKKATLKLKLSIEEMQAFFDQQAADLSCDPIHIQALVLNAGLPE
jgi:hypothetical protein